MKSVFDISGNSRYDDFMSERYHFPRDYRVIAERLVGDWIVYRETRASSDRMAYIAAAFVKRIDQDSNDLNSFYARNR
jgi:putative restriction endonuclease